MASYLARVELHSATYQDYETLHNTMATQGFLRYIVGDNGKNYWLPTGTYVARNALWDISTALARAKTAASQTGKTFEAIIASYDGAMWYGLQMWS